MVLGTLFRTVPTLRNRGGGGVYFLSCYRCYTLLNFITALPIDAGFIVASITLEYPSFNLLYISLSLRLLIEKSPICFAWRKRKYNDERTTSKLIYNTTSIATVRDIYIYILDVYIMDLTIACLPLSYFQFIIFTRKYFPPSQTCILLLAVSKESHVMPAKLTKVPMLG